MVAGAGGDRYDGGQVGESGAEVAFAGGGYMVALRQVCI